MEEVWAKAGVVEEAGELHKHIKPIEFRVRASKKINKEIENRR